MQLPRQSPAAEIARGMLPKNFSWEGSLEEITGRRSAHVERVVLEGTLRDCNWNKTRAAERLGVSPKTLLAKLARGRTGRVAVNNCSSTIFIFRNGAWYHANRAPLNARRQRCRESRLS